MAATYAINTELNGIELTFDGKPGEQVRAALKENGFRWHRARGIWYATHSAARLELAQRLAAAATVTRKEAEAKEAATAWTVERLNSIKEGYTFRKTGDGLYTGWTGCNNGNLHGQELKKAILAELKKNGIKATARERSGCYHTAYTFTVKVPAEMIDTPEAYADRMLHNGSLIPAWVYDENGECVYRENIPYEWEARVAILTAHARHTYRDRVEPVAAFEETVKAIVSSFNSDHSNSMIDYFDVGFYTAYNWIAA